MLRNVLWVACIAVFAAALWWSLGADGATPRAPAVEPERSGPAHDASRPGLERRASRPVSGARPDNAADVAPRPGGLVTLTGRVLDRSGAPLDSDQIELRLAGPGGTRQVRVRGGFYEVDGLEPGRFDVDLVAAGHRSLRASLELALGAGLVVRDFRLEPARWVRLVARSVDGRELGEALAALGLAARRSAPRFVISSRELPAPGSTLNGGVPPSTARLHPEVLVNEEHAQNARQSAASPAFAAQAELAPAATASGARTWVGLVVGSVLLDARELLPADETVVLTLDSALLGEQLGSVGLRVLDRTSGAPLPSVNAWVGTAEATALGQSDAEGKIALEGILPGRVMVYLVAGATPGSLARRAGYADDLHWVDLAPGERVDLGDVLLGAPTRLVLTLEADGRPAPPCDVEVALLRRHGGARLFDPFLARSKVGPEVELELPRRELVIVASNTEAGLRSRPAVVDLASGGDRSGRVVLERATRVELVAASPAAPNWSFLVLDEEGVQAAAGRFDTRGSALLALLPGAYWLTVEDTFGIERASLRCDVGFEPLRLRL